MKATNKKGFTLVEILIVVVILGILAAIVIPQFSEASSEARKSSVQSNLQMIRSQVELFKIQHNETQPGDVSGATHATTFIAALTGKTDSTGAVVSGGAYGPYVQKFPANAYNDAKTVTEVDTADADPTVSTTVGWEWNRADSEFVCPYDTESVDW